MALFAVQDRDDHVYLSPLPAAGPKTAQFEDQFTFAGFFAPEKRLNTSLTIEGDSQQPDVAQEVAKQTGIDVEAAHHALTPEEHIQKALDSWHNSYKCV